MTLWWLTESKYLNKICKVSGFRFFFPPNPQDIFQFCWIFYFDYGKGGRNVLLGTGEEGIHYYWQTTNFNIPLFFFLPFLYTSSYCPPSPSTVLSDWKYHSFQASWVHHVSKGWPSGIVRIADILSKFKVHWGFWQYEFALSPRELSVYKWSSDFY